MFKRDIRVFISYSKSYHYLASMFHEAIAQFDKENDINIWFDELIQPGEIWTDKITDMINWADIFVIFVNLDFPRNSGHIERLG